MYQPELGNSEPSESAAVHHRRKQGGFEQKSARRLGFSAVLVENSKRLADLPPMGIQKRLPNCKSRQPLSVCA